MTGEFKSLEFTPVDDVASLSKEEIIKKIQNAGIVGMGGAGFPTHVKLSPKDRKKSTTLLQTVQSVNRI